MALKLLNRVDGMAANLKIAATPSMSVFIEAPRSRQSSQYASGAVRMSVKTVRSNQMTRSRGKLSGISVDKMHGMTAEKNRIAETDTTAMMNFVTSGASVTSKAGKNISAISMAEAFAANNGSGICNRRVNG